MQIIFLGTARQGFHGNGKQFHFIETAVPILKSLGHSVICLTNVDYIVACDRLMPTIVCMIYNEEGKIDQTIESIEESLKNYFANLRVVHSYGQACIIGDKLRTQRALERYQVPMPNLVNSSSSDRSILSRDVLGSGLPVTLLRSGSELDTTKVNTEFVDTRFTHEGFEYYVCLRSMCFWDRHVATYVRCRDITEGDVSVHSINTPVNAELLNHIYSAIVAPRLSEIIDLCRRAGEALGPGFYSHDLLPPQAGGPIVLCETGFKYDETYLGLVLSSLSGRLLMGEIFNNLESIKMSYTFAYALDRIPTWNAVSQRA